MSRLPGYCSIKGCERPRVGSLKLCESHRKLSADEKKLKIEKPLTGLRRSGKPKPVSEKRKTEMNDYATLRRDYLKENPVCEANLRECTGVATEVHHKAKRGANYLNVETFMAVCKECHILIEQKMSAEERREQGFLMTVKDKPTI